MMLRHRIMKIYFKTILISMTTLLLFILVITNKSFANENDFKTINTSLESIKTIETNIINNQPSCAIKYQSSVRRDIFKDLKSSIVMRDQAEIRIKQAKKQIYKRNMIYNVKNPDEKFMINANDCLNQADEAFNNKNYLKAMLMADKAIEWSVPMGLFFSYYTLPHLRIYYIENKIKHNKNIAMLYIINDNTATGRKIIISKGKIFEERLSKNNTRIIEPENYTQTEDMHLIGYFHVDEITPEKIIISVNFKGNFIYESQQFNIKKVTMDHLLFLEF